MKDGVECKEEEREEEGLPGKLGPDIPNDSLIGTETKIESWEDESKGGQFYRYQLQS
jgi:hypothetical protein